MACMHRHTSTCIQPAADGFCPVVTVSEGDASIAVTDWPATSGACGHEPAACLESNQHTMITTSHFRDVGCSWSGCQAVALRSGDVGQRRCNSAQASPGEAAIVAPSTAHLPTSLPPRNERTASAAEPAQTTQSPAGAVLGKRPFHGRCCRRSKHHDGIWSGP